MVLRLVGVPALLSLQVATVASVGGQESRAVGVWRVGDSPAVDALRVFNHVPAMYAPTNAAASFDATARPSVRAGR